jgi:uncharacterized membrane protein YhaH (DUF805 family)
VPYSEVTFQRLTRWARLCKQAWAGGIAAQKEEDGMNWYLGVLKKYAEFKGRARRREYWTFVLFNILISIVLAVIDVVTGSFSAERGFGILGGLYALAVIIPSIAVGVRRLHDTNRSGWWLLIGLIPCIGLIVLIIFTVQDSQAGDNQYGPNPKAAPAPVTPGA